MNRCSAAEIKALGTYWKKWETKPRSNTRETRLLISLSTMQCKLWKNTRFNFKWEVHLIAKLAYLSCPKVPDHATKLTEGFEFNLKALGGVFVLFCFFLHSLSVNARTWTPERHLQILVGGMCTTAHSIQQRHLLSNHWIYRGCSATNSSKDRRNTQMGDLVRFIARKNISKYETKKKSFWGWWVSEFPWEKISFLVFFCCIL